MSSKTPSSRGRWPLLSVAALAGLLIGTCAADAGVIVLNNGRVLVGRVSSVEGSQDLLVTWRYRTAKDEPRSGRMQVPGRDVRWVDREHDVLTDAYFDRHEQDSLVGAVWLKMLEDYRIRRDRAKSGVDDFPVILPTSLDPLDVPAVEGPGFELRKPRGWKASITDEILVFQAPSGETRGFRPRIHAFVVDGIRDAPETQVEWVQRELARLEAATAGKATFALRGEIELREAEGVRVASFESDTHHAGRVVRTLRRMVFAGGKTYVLCAYAEARDFETYRSLFRASLDSLER